MGKSVSAPPTPNYSQVAQQQGAANVEAARATAKLSNPNIIGPLGSQRVTYGTVDQAGYDKAMAAFNAAGGANQQPQYDEYGNVTSTGLAAPTLAQFTSDADTPTVTQTLNPMGQQTLEEQQKVSLALAQLGQKGVSTAQDVLGTPFKYQGPGIRTDLGNTGQIAQTPNLFQYGQAQGMARYTPQQQGGYGQQQMGGRQQSLASMMQTYGGGQQQMGGGNQQAPIEEAIEKSPARQINPGRSDPGLPPPQPYGQQQQGGPNREPEQIGNRRIEREVLLPAGGPNGQPQQMDVQQQNAPVPVTQTEAEQRAGISKESAIDDGGGRRLQNQYRTMAQTPQGRQQLSQEQGLSESDITRMYGGMGGQQGGQQQGGNQQLPDGVQPVNAGPAMGQYGYAQSGPQAGQYGYAQGNIGPQQRATGGPQAGLFGLQQGGVQGPQLQSQIDTGGPVSGGPAMGQYGMAQGGPSGPQLQQSLDTSNLAAMPVNAGMTAQNAIMSRLEPQLQRQRAQRETQLANQGLVRGGEAYNAAIQEQQQGENDLRTQAALQGLNLDMSARQQGLGEQQALGNFGNQAALSQFGAGQQGNQAQNAAMAQNYAQAQASAQQGNAAQQQQFNQRVQAGEFGNQAQLASFNANLQNQQAGNQAASNNFAQAQAAAQMRNQAAGQNYQQAMGAAGLQNQAVAQNFQQGQQANQAYNQAVQQNMAMGLTAAQAQNQAAQQLYSQLMGSAGFQNQVVQQNQQTALQQQQAQNAAQAQQFNQAMQGAQFGNTAAQQALQQQLSLYNQPLNQISALMSGSQVQMPQFQGYQGANVAAAPIMAGAQAQDQAAMQRYNAAQSGSNALTSGLFGAAGMALGGPMGGAIGQGVAGMFSDRRLKSNIERVGTHPLGIGIYEYDIFDRRERGVMAQEVEQVMPSAVIEHPSGFKMVNYAAL